MNQKALTAELLEQVGFPVVACWRTISVGFWDNLLDGKNDVGRYDDIQALHFECDTKDIPVVMPQLEKCTAWPEKKTNP